MNKNVEVYQLVGMGGDKRWRRGKYQKTEDGFRGRRRKVAHTRAIEAWKK